MDPNNLFLVIIKEFYPHLIALLLLIFKYISIFHIFLFYILFCIYHRIFSKTILIFTPSDINQNFLNKCPIITSLNYKPSFFFPSNHLQLILYQFVKFSKKKYKVISTKQPIGNSGVELDWIKYEGINTENSPILLIIPGLTGGTKDPYVMNLVDLAIENGFNVVIYQMRLLSENITFPHDGTYVDVAIDLDNAIDEIRKKYGKKIKIYGIGYSYGANQLVNYLGRLNYKKKKIEAGVSISNPYDFLVCAKFSENTIWDRILLYFLKKLYKKIKPAVERDKEYNIKGDIILKTNNVHVFDDVLTCKIMGYDSHTDYYRNIGSGQFLRNINVPLLCIHSEDDKITSFKGVPVDDILNNKNIILLKTSNGSHTMFFEDGEGIFNYKQWCIKPAIEFINAVKIVNKY
jgi:abhydrolase domain-containing protein 1/3